MYDHVPEEVIKDLKSNYGISINTGPCLCVKHVVSDLAEQLTAANKRVARLEKYKKGQRHVFWINIGDSRMSLVSHVPHIITRGDQLSGPWVNDGVYLWAGDTSVGIVENHHSTKVVEVDRYKLGDKVTVTKAIKALKHSGWST
jgi:hypothetical protein